MDSTSMTHWLGLKAGLGAISLFMAVGVSASASAHDMYSQWRTHTGGFCCNNKDCRPAEEKLTYRGYEVLISGRWIEVPTATVRQQQSPDGQAHVCHIGDVIVCYQPGLGM